MPVVISCQAQDQVQIGDSVRIVVLEVTESHVRLGITSPDQVPEYREQILRVAEGYDGETDGTAELDRQLVGV